MFPSSIGQSSGANCLMMTPKGVHNVVQNLQKFGGTLKLFQKPWKNRQSTPFLKRYLIPKFGGILTSGYGNNIFVDFACPRLYCNPEEFESQNSKDGHSKMEERGWDDGRSGPGRAESEMRLVRVSGSNSHDQSYLKKTTSSLSVNLGNAFRICLTINYGAIRASSLLVPLRREMETACRFQSETRGRRLRPTARLTSADSVGRWH